MEQFHNKTFIWKLLYEKKETVAVYTNSINFPNKLVKVQIKFLNDLKHFQLIATVI